MKNSKEKNKDNAFVAQSDGHKKETSEKKVTKKVLSKSSVTKKTVKKKSITKKTTKIK